MKKSLSLLAVLCALGLMLDVASAAPRGGGGRAGGGPGGPGGAGGGRPGGAGQGGFGGERSGAGGDRSDFGGNPGFGGGDRSGAGGFNGGFNGGFSGGFNGSRQFDNRANPGGAGDRNRTDNFNGDRPSNRDVNDFLNNKPDANVNRDRVNDPRVNNVDPRNNNIDQRNIYANNNPQWTRNVQNNVQANVNVAARNAFTPQWFNNRPGGWNNYPHADAYAAASWTNAASWLAISAAPIAYYPAGGSSTTYNNYSTTTSDSQYAVTPDPVEQSQYASQLAQTGANVGQTQSGDWLPLGVFALVPGQEKSSNQLVQLQVSKSGTLAGSYLDLLSNSSQPVQGAVDKQSQRAAWNIGSNSQVVFDTTLNGLTQDNAPLTVRFGDNSQQTWTLVRMPEQK